MKELATIGVAYNEDEVENLVNEAKEWITRENLRRHPQLDLFSEEREACDREREEVRRVLSNVSNILRVSRKTQLHPSPLIHIIS